MNYRQNNSHHSPYLRKILSPEQREFSSPEKQVLLFHLLTHPKFAGLQANGAWGWLVERYTPDELEMFLRSHLVNPQILPFLSQFESLPKVRHDGDVVIMDTDMIMSEWDYSGILHTGDTFVCMGPLMEKLLGADEKVVMIEDHRFKRPMLTQMTLMAAFRPLTPPDDKTEVIKSRFKTNKGRVIHLIGFSNGGPIEAHVVLGKNPMVVSAIQKFRASGEFDGHTHRHTMPLMSMISSEEALYLKNHYLDQAGMSLTYMAAVVEIIAHCARVLRESEKVVKSKSMNFLAGFSNLEIPNIDYFISGDGKIRITGLDDQNKISERGFRIIQARVEFLDVKEQIVSTGIVTYAVPDEMLLGLMYLIDQKGNFKTTRQNKDPCLEGNKSVEECIKEFVTCDRKMKLIKRQQLKNYPIHNSLTDPSLLMLLVLYGDHEGAALKLGQLSRTNPNALEALAALLKTNNILAQTQMIEIANDPTASCRELAEIYANEFMTESLERESRGLFDLIQQAPSRSRES